MGTTWVGYGLGSDKGRTDGGRAAGGVCFGFAWIRIGFGIAIGDWVLGIGYSWLVWRTADQIGPLIKIVTIMAKNPPPVRAERPPKWQS